MHIGKLDRIVTIQNYTLAANDYSTKRTKSWVNYATGVPASKDYTPGNVGNETVEAHQQVSVSGGIWVIRYDSGVNDKMRIVYGGVNYYITRVQEIGRSRGLKLTTELRDNE